MKQRTRKFEGINIWIEVKDWIKAMRIVFYIEEINIVNTDMGYKVKITYNEWK